MGFYARFGRSSGFGIVGTGIVGDIGFDSQYADQRWRHGHIGAAYSPANTAVISAAADQWEVLQDLVAQGAPSAGRAKTRLAQLRSDLMQYVSAIESWVSQGIDFDHENGAGFVGSNVVRVYDGINRALSTFANESWPNASDEIVAAAAQADADAAQAKAAADAAAAAQAKVDAAKARIDAQKKQTQDSIAQAQAAIVAASQAAAVAKSSADAHKQAAADAIKKRAALAGSLSTPLTIAAVAVPVAIIAAVVLSRHKSGSMSRYRRRKR